MTEQGHQITVYFATYDHKHQQELTEAFEPYLHKHIFLNGDFSKGNQRDMAVLAMNLIAENVQDYDVIILTRFDLQYLKNLSDMNIDFTKINLLWRETQNMWKAHQRVSDIFHIFPSRLFKPFLNSVWKLRDKSNLHKLYGELIKNGVAQEDIHFIEDGFYDSCPKFKNPLVTIIRGLSDALKAS